MIVYADTSALVKLFVTEAGSEATRQMLGETWVLGTGMLTRAELGAALARGVRRGVLTQAAAREARRRLGVVWPTWVHIMINEDLVARAESLAWEYDLRGYDAVHLAAALVWQESLEERVTLATYDQELWAAARQAQLAVWPDE